MTVPMLMLNGTNDATYPVETSQKPLYSLLGSTEGAKRHRTFEGSHGFVFRYAAQLRTEVLSWLDLHLGPVN